MEPSPAQPSLPGAGAHDPSSSKAEACRQFSVCGARDAAAGTSEPVPGCRTPSGRAASPPALGARLGHEGCAEFGSACLRGLPRDPLDAQRAGRDGMKVSCRAFLERLPRPRQYAGLRTESNGAALPQPQGRRCCFAWKATASRATRVASTRPEGERSFRSRLPARGSAALRAHTRPSASDRIGPRPQPAGRTTSRHG